ncbi:MAG: GTP 3',8-cyclase MoaA [Desulfomonile tiedjei]|nr:GTP 3',8-cyclase MoaA [Desulfomonile tiedjei]
MSSPEGHSGAPSNLLIDPCGRKIDYLRVSITDLCDLRCVYCRPPEGLKLISHDEILRYEEILAFIEVARDMGIRKIRVTGGEPLVRRGVLEFLSRLTAIEGIEDIGLTTNGVRLAGMAQALREAGLKRLNISLDSLRCAAFKAITGGDHLPAVLAGIEAALTEGFHPVKINVVLLRQFNEEDVPAFARLTLEKPVDVRFIERMPFGGEAVPLPPRPFSAREAMEIVEKHVGPLAPVPRDELDGPATMFTLDGAKGRIGIIDPISGHFCGTCNRLRLTAAGRLRPCLLGDSEIDVRSALRRGASREEVADIVRLAVLSKPGGRGSTHTRMAESMNRIGG